MNTFREVLSGLDRARLLSAVDAMDKELTHLPHESLPNATQTPLSALGEAWRHLVGLLELGSEPKLRECPMCRKLCMIEATRCGHCWTPLPALERPPTLPSSA